MSFRKVIAGESSNCVDAVGFVEELLDLPEVPQGPGLLRNTR